MDPTVALLIEISPLWNHQQLLHEYQRLVLHTNAEALRHLYEDASSKTFAEA